MQEEKNFKKRRQIACNRLKAWQFGALTQTKVEEDGDPESTMSNSH